MINLLYILKVHMVDLTL